MLLGQPLSDDLQSPSIHTSCHRSSFSLRKKVRMRVRGPKISSSKKGSRIRRAARWWFAAAKCCHALDADPHLALSLRERNSAPIAGGRTPSREDAPPELGASANR